MDAAAFSIRHSHLYQRCFTLALIALFMALSVKYTDKVLDDTRDNRSAFLRWRAQVLEIDAGINIWARHNYPNPPIMVLLLRPLMALPPLVGALVWFYLKAAMALAAIHLAFRLVETAGRPFPLWAKVLAAGLSLRPIMGDLSHGNVNLFILLLCVGALFLFRLRRDGSAGVCLALAIACKVTPALLVPYFLYKRAWKTLAGCAVGLVLFFYLVPGLCLGWTQNQSYLLSWYKVMIEPYAINGVVTTNHENQSLPGLAHRLLTQSASFSIFVDDRYVPTEYHNLVAWDPALVRVLVKLCMLVFVAAVVWTCRNSTKDRPRWQLAAEYALILLGMLLFSERTWKHHCVLLLVPFGVLSYCLAEVQVSQKVKRYVIATLIIVVLLMASTSTGWSRSFDRVGELAQVYGAYVWANLALVIALVVVLRCDFLSARRQVLSEVSQVSAARKRGAARKQINHEPPAHTERGSPECALSN